MSESSAVQIEEIKYINISDGIEAKIKLKNIYSHKPLMEATGTINNDKKIIILIKSRIKNEIQ